MKRNARMGSLHAGAASFDALPLCVFQSPVESPQCVPAKRQARAGVLRMQARLQIQQARAPLGKLVLCQSRHAGLGLGKALVLRADEPEICFADPTVVFQATQNLVMNALHAARAEQLQPLLRRMVQTMLDWKP